MRELFPEQNVENSSDNVGLLIGDSSDNIGAVLCCLDVTGAVIDEAINTNAKLIISHHPFLFYSIKSITNDTVLGAKIIRIIKSGISVYSAHTNMDFSYAGINRFCGIKLGLSGLSVLDPYISEREGMGILGSLPAPITAMALKERAGEIFEDKRAAIIGNENKIIKKVAILNGGGGGDTKALEKAIECGADAFITGDVKHHVALFAHEIGLPIIEIQHFLMEHLFIKQLPVLLRKKFEEKGLDAKVYYCENEKNPLK
jgi:dinuclear metal center YbgI/SA1388 family protein